MRSLISLLLVVGALPAQIPRIGIIDFYGVRKVSGNRLLKALGVKEGDALPPSKSELEERLETIPGVVRARVEAVCCESGKAILFVGIEEKGARHSEFHSVPGGNATLPQEIVETHERFLGAVEEAARRGSTAQDLTSGHSLMADPGCRQLQERFVVLAAEHLATLRDVLRNAADEGQRARAAEVIGYAPNKKLVVDDLQYALQDPDDRVRNNAARALAAIAVLARRDPDQEIKIRLTWFIEMLNSIVWSDRSKALMALVNLTDDRNADMLAQIRDRAFDALIEMARWNSLPHALPAYILLGRVAGKSEQEIQDTWSKGEREATIQRILKPRRGQ